MYIKLVALLPSKGPESVHHNQRDRNDIFTLTKKGAILCVML